MLQEPLPDPPPDDDEPVGSSPAGDSGAPWPDDDPQGPEQGLFVCLPAEELSLAGFAQNGQADTMAPGPLLGTVLHTVIGEDGAGLPGLSDDQLIGVLSAGRRMEAWTAWTQLAAMRELARRRPAQEPGDSGRAGFSDFAADELMGEFHLTWEAATAQIGYACTVADRLPRTFAALAAGQIHPVAVKIIEDETRYLSAKNAAKADAVLAELARSRSFARLRYAAHRLVLKLDPDYAKLRKDEDRKSAHVRRFRENSGNAGMVAHEMPPDEVLASWQHVEQRALDLRAAGMPGTLQELRVRAYLDLLQETDSRPAPGRGQGAADPAGAVARAGTAVPSLRPATRAGSAAAPVTTPSRASRRWSRSPCRSRRCRAGPRPPARSARSASRRRGCARPGRRRSPPPPDPLVRHRAATQTAPLPHMAAPPAGTRPRAAPTSPSPVVPPSAPIRRPAPARRTTCAA